MEPAIKLPAATTTTVTTTIPAITTFATLQTHMCFVGIAGFCI